MDSNRQYPYDVDSHPGEAVERISTAQLQRLVDLLDGSDVSEIEVKRVEEGMRLVLRKAKAQSSDVSDYSMLAPSPGDVAPEPASEAKHTVTAPLVGIFHTWAKPKGKDLVAVGDTVKIGQILGTIQSLNVLNEVESGIAGRIAEIFIQDGQAVEYGQQLMTIERIEGA